MVRGNRYQSNPDSAQMLIQNLKAYRICGGI
jgi:hypothetical protein